MFMGVVNILAKAQKKWYTSHYQKTSFQLSKKVERDSHVRLSI